MNFKTVETFGTAADILREYYTGDVSDEILNYLDHINDFDSFGFLVINSEIVIAFDTLSGDVYGRMTLDEFMQLSITEALEEISDEI